uniref:Peroxin-13 n=1 Tax=Rhabditophanes sp. KR3021 TaxID=114890 RepID=A0AC35U5Q0_9BILA
MGDKQPPPLPPKPNQYNGGGGDLNSGYGYNNPMYGYNSGGMNAPYNMGYSGNNMYGGNMNSGMYGGGNYMYNGAGTNQENSFVRLAEESTRGAFQSIESIVNAAASVANMLSSTHNAVFSSFRAVIGVVEQLSRLKMQMTGILESAFVFGLIRKFWKWLMVKLRLMPESALVNEEVWNAQQKQMKPSDWIVKELGGQTENGVSWPTLLFWVVAIGGPWLIYKCVKQMVSSIEESRQWATGTSEHYTAKALHSFQASTNNELSFSEGDQLRVAPKDQQPPTRGWLLASSDDGQRVGLVPINYIQLLNRKTKSPPTVMTNPLDKMKRAKESHQEEPKQYSKGELEKSIENSC